MNDARPESGVCFNCGASVGSNYCPECGQENVSTLVSFRTLIAQFLDDFLSLDSTLLRSLGLLFFRPGELSLEYSRGRRKRYASPIRIYLIASVSFFLVASFMVNRSSRNGGGGGRGANPAEAGAPTDPRGVDSTSAAAGDEGSGGGRGGGGPGWTRWIPLPDSLSVGIDEEIATLHPEHYEIGPAEFLAIGPEDTLKVPTWLARRLTLPSLPESVRTALAELDPNSLSTDYGDDDGTLTVTMAGTKYELDKATLLSKIFSITPKMLFVLFPVFALLLQIIYRRRKRYYVEHLVFSLHCHAFLFALLTLVVLTRKSQILLVALAIIAVYVYFAMKRLYGQGWVKTALKFLILAGGYLALVGATAVLTLMASVWMLTGLGG